MKEKKGSVVTNVEAQRPKKQKAIVGDGDGDGEERRERRTEPNKSIKQRREAYHLPLMLMREAALWLRGERLRTGKAAQRSGAEEADDRVKAFYCCAAYAFSLAASFFFVYPGESTRPRRQTGGCKFDRADVGRRGPSAMLTCRSSATFTD